jgi:hypothetical protein
MRNPNSLKQLFYFLCEFLIIIILLGVCKEIIISKPIIFIPAIVILIVVLNITKNITTNFNDDEEIKSIMNNIENAYNINKDDFIKIIFKDYDIICKETERRENITLTVGTILVASSFLILGNAIIHPEQKVISCIASISLFFSWWSMLYITTKKIDEETYRKIRSIETWVNLHRMNIPIKNYNEDNNIRENIKENPFFGTHLFLNKYRVSEGYMKYIRSNFWEIIFFVMCANWIYFILA